jgi:hypothetical protein
VKYFASDENILVREAFFGKSWPYEGESAG